tara:strand:- start:103 stop:1464 length:1362 start_codon:yes stop_codon:yes gene_type:complete
MFLFSIKGLSEMLGKDSYYSSIKKEDNKLLFIDKCNWLITSVYRSNFANEQDASYFQNLHSDQLKRVLGGRYYKQIINSLSGIGLIAINEKYSLKRFSKSFAITDKSIELGIEKVEVKTKRFNSTINNLTRSEFDSISEDDLIKKVLVNTAKLYLVKDFGNYMAKILPTVKVNKPIDHIDLLDLWLDKVNTFKVDRYSSYFDSFLELNNHSDPYEIFKLPVFFKPKIADSGRVYHIGAAVPKHIRECFTTKGGDPIYDVDMSSAQPSILFLEWMRFVKSKEKINKTSQNEFKLCRELLLTGSIYSYVKDNSSYYSKYRSNEEYPQLKKEILTSLNGNNDKAPFVRALVDLFPEFMGWIKEIKDAEGYQAISHIGQKAEANIFVKVFQQLPDNIFSLIIHDCILTTENNTLMVRQLLVNRLRELYGDIIPAENNLDKVFKISRVTLKRYGNKII